MKKLRWIAVPRVSLVVVLASSLLLGSAISVMASSSRLTELVDQPTVVSIDTGASQQVPVTWTFPEKGYGEPFRFSSPSNRSALVLKAPRGSTFDPRESVLQAYYRYGNNDFREDAFRFVNCRTENTNTVLICRNIDGARKVDFDPGKSIQIRPTLTQDKNAPSGQERGTSEWSMDTWAKNSWILPDWAYGTDMTTDVASLNIKTPQSESYGPAKLVDGSSAARIEPGRLGNIPVTWTLPNDPKNPESQKDAFTFSTPTTGPALELEAPQGTVFTDYYSYPAYFKDDTTGGKFQQDNFRFADCRTTSDRRLLTCARLDGPLNNDFQLLTKFTAGKSIQIRPQVLVDRGIPPYTGVTGTSVWNMDIRHLNGVSGRQKNQTSAVASLPLFTPPLEGSERRFFDSLPHREVPTDSGRSKEMKRSVHEVPCDGVWYPVLLSSKAYKVPASGTQKLNKGLKNTLTVSQAKLLQNEVSTGNNMLGDILSMIPSDTWKEVAKIGLGITGTPGGQGGSFDQTKTYTNSEEVTFTQTNSIEITAPVEGMEATPMYYKLQGWGDFYQCPVGSTEKIRENNYYPVRFDVTQAQGWELTNHQGKIVTANGEESSLDLGYLKEIAMEKSNDGAGHGKYHPEGCVIQGTSEGAAVKCPPQKDYQAFQVRFVSSRLGPLWRPEIIDNYQGPVILANGEWFNFRSEFKYGQRLDPFNGQWMSIEVIPLTDRLPYTQ